MTNQKMEGEGFEKRKKCAEDSLIKTQGKNVPVCVKRSANSRITQISKTKYAVPVEQTLGQFMLSIRAAISIRSEECIFAFIDNCIPSTSATMGELYQQYHKEDKILYITYTDESVYGGI